MTEKTEDIFKEIILLNFQRNFIKLKEIGLYPGQELILEYLVKHKGVTQRELVAFTKRSAPTIAKAIQRMVQNGYIKRTEDKMDKRISHLYATQKGKETYAKIVKLKEEECQYYQFLFNDIEKENIRNYLIRIRESLKGVNENEKNI